MIDASTHHWRPGCYPRRCDPPQKPQNMPNTPSVDTHNVLYLIDEHILTNPKDKPDRTAKPQRRYVWHYGKANLDTFNYGEVPDTIMLHEKISNPQLNPSFRWEGFMFDIPGSLATARVAIAAGAEKATDGSLTTTTGGQAAVTDRPVGFVGAYPDNTVPIGPIVQVRRDDQYRSLNSCLNDDRKTFVSWHCAYYISKDTPRKPSAFTGFMTIDEDQNQSLDHPPSGDDVNIKADVDAYDTLMDNNVPDDTKICEGELGWGGFVLPFNAKASSGNYDDEALAPYDDDARAELNG